MVHQVPINQCSRTYRIVKIRIGRIKCNPSGLQPSPLGALVVALVEGIVSVVDPPQSLLFAFLFSDDFDILQFGGSFASHMTLKISSSTPSLDSHLQECISLQLSNTPMSLLSPFWFFHGFPGAQLLQLKETPSIAPCCPEIPVNQTQSPFFSKKMPFVQQY